MEITNNQNAESFVVRELTEKSNGNAKYFLLSNGNIRAEFYASEYAETISAQETTIRLLPLRQPPQPQTVKRSISA